MDIFKTSIQSKVMKAVKAKIAEVQKAFDEDIRRLEEQFEYEKKNQLEVFKNDKKIIEDTHIKNILGKIL